MKKLAMLVGVLALAVIAIGPFAYVTGSLSLEAYKWAALVSTIVWFAAVMWPGAETSMEQAIDE